MAQKCKTGYKVKDGRCVKVSRGTANPFKPSDSLTKFFLWGTIITVVLSALMGAGFLLFGTFNETTIKILLTTLTLGGVSLFGLVSGNNANGAMKFGGIATAVGAGLMWILLVWEVITLDNEWTVRFAVILSIVAFAFAHASILSKAKSRDGLVKGVFWTVIALIVAVAGMLVYAVMKDQIFDVGVNFWRVLGALAILDVAGSIALPILKKVRN